MAGLHSTGFDRLSVQDGRVRIVGAANGATPEISGVEIDAAAPSLDGPSASQRPVFRPGQCSRRLQARLGKAGSEGDACSRRGGRRAELACRRIRRRARRRPGRRDWRPSVRRRRHVDRNRARRGCADSLAGRGTDHRRSQPGRPARGGISSRTGGTSDPGGWGRHARLRLARPDQRRAEGQTGQCRLAHAPQGRGRGRARARRGADHPHRVGGASGP